MSKKLEAKPIGTLLSEVLPEDTHEQTYRRAYRDGWVQAIETMHDLMFSKGMARQEAYDRCWYHWEHHLLTWQQRAKNENTFEKPPEV